jgi:hypothetical protein
MTLQVQTWLGLQRGRHRDHFQPSNAELAQCNAFSAREVR